MNKERVYMCNVCACVRMHVCAKCVITCTCMYMYKVCM